MRPEPAERSGAEHAELFITNSTFVGNTISPGTVGATLGSYDGPVNLANTILSQPTQTKNCGSALGAFPDGHDQGGNFSTDDSCNFQTSQVVTADSLHLGGFGDHGGPTPTISLLPGSVALHAGGQSACDLSGADQTGFARQSGAVCDSGAVESDVVPPELPSLPSILVTADGPDGAQVEYSVGALDARDGPIPATCSPESGSLFSVGNTGVFCSATDRAGNTSSPGSFTVHVERATGSLTVELSVDAAGSNFTGGLFTFNADCGVEGGSRDGALTYPYTSPLVFGHIPTGDECIVNETQRPDAPVGFHWGIESTDGSPALIMRWAGPCGSTTCWYQTLR